MGIALIRCKPNVLVDPCIRRIFLGVEKSGQQLDRVQAESRCVLPVYARKQKEYYNVLINYALLMGVWH